VTGETALLPRPGNKVIKLGGDGAPYIQGYRCDACGAVVAEPTMACRACASRTPPSAFKAVQAGKLWSWSIVSRSYPGVAVPFVSAIVDLDDGLTLKGTVKGVSDDALRQGLPLRLVFDDAGGARDKEGAPYIGFHFVPEGAAS
jgi:uncharacterized OB-fold protein